MLVGRFYGYPAVRLVNLRFIPSAVLMSFSQPPQLPLPQMDHPLCAAVTPTSQSAPLLLYWFLSPGYQHLPVGLHTLCLYTRSHDLSSGHLLPDLDYHNHSLRAILP